MQDLGKFLSKISPYPDPLQSLIAPLTALSHPTYSPLLPPTDSYCSKLIQSRVYFCLLPLSRL